MDRPAVPGLAVAERRVSNPRATVICIHGGLDRAGSFARLARRSESFDLLAYDRRGYQGSRNHHAVGLEGDIDDLLELANDEARGGPVIFFGHSYGGVIALGAALRTPTLAALALVYEAPLPWILTRTSSRPELTDDPELEAEIFFKRVVSKGAWDRLSERERESRRLDGSALLSDLRTLRAAPPFDLAALTTPTVYLHGDGILAPYYRALCTEISLVNPAVTAYELVNAGHGAHLANPDQLAATISELWGATCASA